MRFLLLIYPNISTDEDWTPTAESVAEMTRFNNELAQAGALLALDGLTPPSEGARVEFADGTVTVNEGAAAGSGRVLGGFWVIQVGSKEEAIEWVRRCPVGGEATIEIRRIAELEDFPPEVREAAEMEQQPRQPVAP